MSDLPSQARAVVIGGGVVGCSILYHLARLGWNDIVLLERDELTSGSTWHAAANIHGLHDTNNISRLQYYTMQLYDELERETGQSCGIFRPGALYLAQTREREHQLRIQAAKARYFGVEFHELSHAEARDMHPLVEFGDIRCVMFEPDGGNVDPSGVTQAFAAAARARGAVIHRFTPVTGTQALGDGSWEVVTPKGMIRTEVVVNAAGLWAREVGALVGLDLPLVPMEHQYFVTETIPQVAALDRRLPSVSDRDGEYYLRQEGQGLLVGVYERDGRFWAEDGTPQDFGHELFPDDLDRISENVMRACARVPALETAGIRRVINGPMIWSPDAAALLGPVPDLPGYYCCVGIIPGFSQCGGLGQVLAQWIVEGEPELDLFPWDVARYDGWTTREFVRARALDCYSNRFRIHFPHEEREAGRPVRVRPARDEQRDRGAVFGLNSGWEHALWYAGPGVDPRDSAGFERQHWFEPVGEECRALRERAGILDISTYAKYEVSGPGARDWLPRVVANRVPAEPGRSCLTPVLGLRGGVAADFTVTCLEEERYLVIGSGAAEGLHRRLLAMVPRPPEVELRSRSAELAGFNLAGPDSRRILQRLTNTDLSNESFGFARTRQMTVGGLDAIGLRMSFSGDLGWEIYVAEKDQRELFLALLEAGGDFGVRPVGSRALLSLRVEKGYGSWGREYSPEYWPHEVGLARLVRDDKPAFLGRDAWLGLRDRAPREKLVMLEVETGTADAADGEPIFLPDGGAAVGRVSSGAYSWHAGASLALAFIDTDHVAAGAVFDVALLGLAHRAVVLERPPFDPDGLRLRG